jgi:DNA polymerase III alpha subunit
MIYNDYGHQIYQESDLISLLINGESIDELSCEDSEDIQQYNLTNHTMGTESPIVIYATPELSPKEYHASRIRFNLPDEYQNLELIDYISNKVDQHEFDYDISVVYHRICEELLLFHECGMEDYLRAIIYLIDTMNSKNVVRGCGRGSSVASFILFVIGVHYIDPIKYDINISEFLRKQ